MFCGSHTHLGVSDGDELNPIHCLSIEYSKAMLYVSLWLGFNKIMLEE